jgi:polyhydroxyalkanoate synthesis regulator phasin
MRISVVVVLILMMAGAFFAGYKVHARNIAPLLAERSQLILDKGLVCRTQVETAQARGFVQDVLNNSNGKLDDIRKSRLKMADDDLAEVQLVLMRAHCEKSQ